MTSLQPPNVNSTGLDHAIRSWQHRQHQQCCNSCRDCPDTLTVVIVTVFGERLGEVLCLRQ